MVEPLKAMNPLIVAIVIVVVHLLASSIILIIVLSEQFDEPVADGCFCIVSGMLCAPQLRHCAFIFSTTGFHLSSKKFHTHICSIPYAHAYNPKIYSIQSIPVLKIFDAAKQKR